MYGTARQGQWPGERAVVAYNPEPQPEGFYLVLSGGGAFLELGRVREIYEPEAAG